MVIRTSFYIDGFNLYHGLKDLDKPHLKWLNLYSLCEEYANPPMLSISNVYYFTAYAEWMADACRRHKKYCKALKKSGVKVVLGNFKEKTTFCKNCNQTFKAHEEKETDVNIALYLLRDAYIDSYDKAVVITTDSDLATAVRMVKSQYPDKAIISIAPPGRRPSRDIIEASDENRKKHKTIQMIHLERNLLPAEFEYNGELILRPTEYDIPKN